MYGPSRVGALVTGVPFCGGYFRLVGAPSQQHLHHLLRYRMYQKRRRRNVRCLKNAICLVEHDKLSDPSLCAASRCVNQSSRLITCWNDACRDSASSLLTTDTEPGHALLPQTTGTETALRLESTLCGRCVSVVSTGGYAAVDSGSIATR